MIGRQELSNRVSDAVGGILADCYAEEYIPNGDITPEQQMMWDMLADNFAELIHLLIFEKISNRDCGELVQLEVRQLETNELVESVLTNVSIKQCLDYVMGNELDHPGTWWVIDGKMAFIDIEDFYANY